MKRKLASVLVSLVFGWLATAALAGDETTSGSADTSTAASEPATPTDPSADTAGTDSSTADGTIGASPTETDAK